MKLLFTNDWLRRHADDIPVGCKNCGVIPGACSVFPNCPGGLIMMTMRAKMKVHSVQKHGDPVTGISLTFGAVARSDGYPADGSDDNNTFARWTPSAAIQMSIQNPALFDTFETGREYYVDFTPAA